MISEVLRKVQNEFLLNISTEIAPLPKVPNGYVSDGGDFRNVKRCKLPNPISSIYSVKSGRFTCTLKGSEWSRKTNAKLAKITMNHNGL
ncbi:hypothetical protein COF84_25700 [Bacillus wiedmannii]|uniref:hypothetical protein n=1 Tax=Bacillus wiedmannii TaxID=1890302 RepID=UPI000BFC6427|nr:hypothetical protein [Bacillus wiedmannii]PHF12376.1 hypothetical protein COF84_25700 [Bacillus wiedmannii]